MMGSMKRLIAGPLWFLAALLAYEIVWSLVDVPRAIGPVLAAVVTATVWLDPWHWFWVAPPGGPTEGMTSSAHAES